MRHLINITRRLLESSVPDDAGYAVAQLAKLTHQHVVSGDSDYDTVRHFATIIGNQLPEYKEITERLLAIKPRDWDRYASWMDQVATTMAQGIKGRDAARPVHASSEHNVNYDPYERDGYYRQNKQDADSERWRRKVRG